MKKNRSAFSLIELSIVILVIGLIIAGIAQSSALMRKAALTSARAQTNSAPVALIPDLGVWFESTAERSFVEDEAKDGVSINNWYNIAPNATSDSSNATACTNKPTYKLKSQNNLPTVAFASASTQCFDLPENTLPVSNNDYTVFIVSLANSVSGTVIASGDGTGSTNLSNTFGYDDNGYFTNIWDGDDYATAASQTGTFKIFSVIYKYAFLNNSLTNSRVIYVNGVAETASTPAGVKASTTVRNKMGANSASTPANYLNGEIAEVIIYYRALKDSERQDVEKYLSKKWRIPLV